MHATLTFASASSSLALTLGLLAVGCAPPPVRLAVPDVCRRPATTGQATVAGAVKRANSWLKVAPISKDVVVCAPGDLAGEGRSARDEGKDRTKRRTIKVSPGMLAVRSFSGDGEGILSGRSYIYDNALALLWFAWTGDEQTSSGLASTLVASQDSAGAWGPYLPLRGDDCYNDRYVRSGIVGWAAYALSYYGKKYASAEATAGASRAATYLEANIVPGRASLTAGLVKGGRGRWVKAGDGERFDADYRMTSAVTEHQLDAHQALAHMGRPAAEGLGRKIMHKLWLAGPGRFALAMHSHDLDGRRALDAAGAWGALWALGTGREQAARLALRYTLKAFATEDRCLAGYRPYLDPVEGPESVRHEDLIFVEGTMGVGLAAHRLGDEDTARRALALAAQLSCSTGGGLPYANVEAAGFTTRPGAASTLWFLLLEREMRLGEPSPLFSRPVVG